MQILINDPVQSTLIFIGILLMTLAVSFRFKRQEGLSLSVTQELKGFAILAIIFAHIGYVLVTDNRFLFPISVLAGVGVSLFLFLSGYGLTKSALKKKESILQFYKRKSVGLFIPFWIILIFFLILDYIILHTTYSWNFIFKAFFGIFTHANAFTDLNSPLWYFTLILIYHLFFPLIFFKKYPWVSGLLLYACTYILFYYMDIKFLKENLPLYKVYLVAFPFGICVAGLLTIKSSAIQNAKNQIKKTYEKFEKILYPLVTAILIFIIGHTAIYSGVGKGIRLEQTYILITAMTFVCLFVIKKYEFRLLSLFGLYSYEIYLLHWPLVSRYDIFYKYVPAWLATVLYLVMFTALGFLLKKISYQCTQALLSRQNSKI